MLGTPSNLQADGPLLAGLLLLSSGKAGLHGLLPLVYLLQPGHGIYGGQEGIHHASVVQNPEVWPDTMATPRAVVSSMAGLTSLMSNMVATT